MHAHVPAPEPNSGPPATKQTHSSGLQMHLPRTFILILTFSFSLYLTVHYDLHPIHSCIFTLVPKVWHLSTLLQPLNTN